MQYTLQISPVHINKPEQLLQNSFFVQLLLSIQSSNIYPPFSLIDNKIFPTNCKPLYPKQNIKTNQSTISKDDSRSTQTQSSAPKTILKSRPLDETVLRRGQEDPFPGAAGSPLWRGKEH